MSDEGNQVTRIWQGLIAHDGSVELDVSGHHARGNAQEVANWIGYGEDVLAVADAALLAGEGLPFAIARHEALGDYPDLDDFDAGKPCMADVRKCQRPSPSWISRETSWSPPNSAG